MTRDSSSKKTAFDIAQMIPKALSILQHLRLICILAVLGAMAGMIAFSYTTPVYYSRSLLSWQVFDLPFHDETEIKSQGSSYFTLWRTLKLELEADQLKKDVAVKLGIAKPSDDIEAVRNVIRISRILYRDHNTLVIEVYATDPEVVREYPAALVEAYQEHKMQQRKEHRDKAVARYIVESDQLREKINEELTKKADFEKQNELATLAIRQERLIRLPADLERSKSQLKRMDEIRGHFSSTSDKLDVVGKLSLLSAFEKEWANEEKAKTGDVVKRAPTDASPFLQGPAPLSTNVDVVVVNPQVEEGADPWRKLEKEHRSLTEDIRQNSQKYLPGHEIMVKLTDRLREVNHLLEVELQVALQRFELEYNRVKNRLPEIERQMPEYYATVSEYEKHRTNYSILAKEGEDWKTAQTELRKKIGAIQFGDMKQQIELLFGNYEQLDDKQPISPTTSKALMISLALALGLGLGVPIALEFINSTVSRIPQIEGRLGLRGLGMVPVASKKLLEDVFRSPAIGARVPNFLLECFRVIRSNIILHPGQSGKSQVIAITSARPSEGKSTLAANLSWAFFSMGERTLLIDTDLRRGRIHEILNLDNTAGLSSYFEGKVAVSDIIRSTENPNLEVLTRGPFVAGASEFLCRDVFADLIAELRTKYDRIILDGPPVLGLSETIAIQRVTDGVVVVVRAENTKMMDVELCVDQLKRGGANIFGFTLNRLDLSKPANHYYYYYSSPYYYTNIEGETGGPGHVVAA